MKITENEYSKMVKKASPPSKSYKTIPLAFLIGGLICVLGQLLIAFYQKRGLNVEDASTCASVTLVLISALLTGLDIYDDIARFGGAGTLVPITGFANAVCSPAIEFKAEGFILGLGAKMFIIAGPVIVYGILASIVYGAVVFILTLI